MMEKPSLVQAFIKAAETQPMTETCPDCEGLGYLGGEDTPSSCMNKFHKLALSGSFERVAKVAKEREAFNEQMALRDANIERTHTMDNTNAVLAGELDITNADNIALWLNEHLHDYAQNLPISWLAVQIVEAHESALRQQAKPTQTDALREALETAPIISQWEGPAEFRARQDEWLQGKYKAALEVTNG